VNVGLACHFRFVGIFVAVDVVIAYCTLCPPGLVPEGVRVFTVMLLCVRLPILGAALTADPVPLLTTILTLNFAENVAPSAPLTVTVALCVLTPIPVFGVTVNVAVLPPAILPIVVTDVVKLPACAPDSAIVNGPMGWLPLFVIVTDSGLLALLVKVLAANVCNVVLFRVMPPVCIAALHLAAPAL